MGASLRLPVVEPLLPTVIVLAVSPVVRRVRSRLGVQSEDDRRRIHADPARSVRPQGARGRTGHSLPVLPQHGRVRGVGGHSADQHLHELRDPSSRVRRPWPRATTACRWSGSRSTPRLRILQPLRPRPRGVSCVECHGRVDTMEVVYQHETLSMGWCLSCTRPAPMYVIRISSPSWNGMGHGCRRTHRRGCQGRMPTTFSRIRTVPHVIDAGPRARSGAVWMN